MKNKLLDINDVARQLNISKYTIYSNPSQYRMFKIGRMLRTTQKDIDDYIAESRKKHDNATRLTLGKGAQEVKKCPYSRETVSTISISEHPSVKELNDLLKPKTDAQLKNTMTKLNTNCGQ